MKARIRTQIVAAVAMTVIGFCAGCGDGNNNDNTNGPVPTRTATPARTATPVTGRTATPAAGATATPVATSTPGGATSPATVAFTTNASAASEGFDVRVTYPTSKGSFRGTADTTACTLQTAGPILLSNDSDDGNLKIVVALVPGPLTFPVTINCIFDQITGQTLVAADVVATPHGFTTGTGTDGDPTSLTVSVSVTQG
jgi:hypothetical protein